VALGQIHAAGNKRALAISEKALGAEHPDTGTSLNNLASLLESQGDYAGAKRVYERALAISEKALGAEHPSTKIIRENLAGLGGGDANTK
jgi:tetratricopeptide (TPR) repeat protein